MIASALARVSRTAVPMSPAVEAARKVGRPPLLGGATAGEEAAAPRNDTEAMPVRPAYSSVTTVSERTGVDGTIEMTAATSDGFSVRRISVTSPTRMPLNKTGPPTRKPDTEPSNTTRYGLVSFDPDAPCSQ